MLLDEIEMIPLDAVPAGARVIHVTERRSFRNCRREWDYSSPNRQGLERIVAPGALTLGTLVHQALDNWFANPTTSLRDYYSTHAITMLRDVQREYESRVGAPMGATEEAALDKTVELGRAMMVNYEAFYGRPLPAGFELVATEQTMAFRVPASYPTGDVYLAGKLDKVIRDAKGRYYVVDHKTYEQRTQQTLLDFDDQFLGYNVMLDALYRGKADVVGVAYDGLWKRAAPTKSKPSMADLFYRCFLTRNRHEMNEWLENLIYEAREMSDVNIPIYPNRGWTCPIRCSFLDLCYAQSRGDDTEYLRQTMYRRRGQVAEVGVRRDNGNDTDTDTGWY